MSTNNMARKKVILKALFSGASLTFLASCQETGPSDDYTTALVSPGIMPDSDEKVEKKILDEKNQVKQEEWIADSVNVLNPPKDGVVMSGEEVEISCKIIRQEFTTWNAPGKTKGGTTVNSGDRVIGGTNIIKTFDLADIPGSAPVNPNEESQELQTDTKVLKAFSSNGQEVLIGELSKENIQYDNDFKITIKNNLDSDNNTDIDVSYLMILVQDGNMTKWIKIELDSSIILTLEKKGEVKEEENKEENKNTELLEKLLGNLNEMLSSGKSEQLNSYKEALKKLKENNKLKNDPDLAYLQSNEGIYKLKDLIENIKNKEVPQEEE